VVGAIASKTLLGFGLHRGDLAALWPLPAAAGGYQSGPQLVSCHEYG
jgi:hypothetical protein